MSRTPIRLALTVLAAIAMTVSSAVVAPTAASADTSCTGSFRFDQYAYSGANYAHEYGWYWSTSGAVCVGQADEVENLTNATGLLERVRVHDGPSNGTLLKEYYTSGGTIDGDKITFTTYVRRVFFVPDITVCVAVVHGDHSVVPNTTVCKSLP